jgi:hypothetical protein
VKLQHHAQVCIVLFLWILFCCRLSTPVKGNGLLRVLIVDGGGGGGGVVFVGYFFFKKNSLQCGR